jgi:hypothetical protein
MGNNKFNDFYSEKTVKDLVELIRQHRTMQSDLGQEWFEGLQKHLDERNLSTDEKKEVDFVLTENIRQLEKKAELKKENNQKIFPSHPISVPVLVNKSDIIAAGKAIKNVVYIAIVMIISAIVAIFISANSSDIDIIKNTYIAIGTINLFCYIALLIKFYEAGEKLENSVKEN